MSRIAIVTDTDSSLPLEISEKLSITQVPIIVQFGDMSYEDVFQIKNDTLFSKIDREGKLPTTAAPSPGQFLEAFKQTFKSGADSIICFNISSEMSATYASAKQAAELIPEHRIEVIDTRSLAMGQGYMILAAAEAISCGASIEEAIAAAEETRNRTFLFGALSTLRYIAMSGRVSSLAAGMAGLLDIKPILSLQNGKLELVEKIRTQGKSWSRTIELIQANAANRKIEKFSILHVNAPEAALQFEELLRNSLNCPEEAIRNEVNAGLSVHTGAGMVAVVIVVEK